jgi:hypothetical protein
MGLPSSDFGPATLQHPLLTKQAIIVLREELEYFSIPPKVGKATTNEQGIMSEALLDIKRQSGKYLMEKLNISLLSRGTCTRKTMLQNSILLIHFS